MGCLWKFWTNNLDENNVGNCILWVYCQLYSPNIVKLWLHVCCTHSITCLQFCNNLAALPSLTDQYLSLSIVPRNPRTHNPWPVSRQNVSTVKSCCSGSDRLWQEVATCPCYHVKVMQQQLVGGNHDPKVSRGQTAPCTHLWLQTPRWPGSSPTPWWPEST